MAEVQKKYMSTTGWNSCVRGLRCSEVAETSSGCDMGRSSDKPVVRLRAHRDTIWSMLKDDVFPLLERWAVVAIKGHRMAHACIVQAHLVFMFKNVEEQDLTKKIVSTMLIAQQFLTINYRYDVEVDERFGEGKSKTWGKAKSKSSSCSKSSYSSAAPLMPPPLPPRRYRTME